MTFALPEGLTFRALAAGFVFSLVLCTVNSYLTLSFGVIEEGPTIAALFFFATFFLSKKVITKTEMVIVATMGSAGGSLGFITNFFAAQVMIGDAYTLGEMAGFAVVTSVLGMLFVVPLRDLLILRENLPWPSSRATAAVITVLTERGDKRQPLYLLVTILVGMFYVVANTEDGLGWFPADTALPLFGLSAYGAAIAWSPFALGGSYLMGFRTCVGFLTGAVILLAIAPRLPEAQQAAPHRYIWPGMGFLLASGLTTMVLNWRVITDSMRSLLQLRGTSSTDDDPIMSGRGLVIFAVFAIALTFAYGVFVMGLNLLVLLVLVVVGGLIQNLIATRAAAQTAFNPARVMGVLVQGACALVGGTRASVNLSGAGVVAGSGAQAGVLLGDLAYGRWLKVPSRWQYWTQLATVIPCSLVAAYVFMQIQAQDPLMLEGGTHPAPVAKMWAATALIFDGTTAMPHFAVEAMLIAGAVGVVYTLLEATKLSKFLPGAVGVGIGLVLPVAYDISFFVGGFVMWIVLGRWLKIRDLTLTTLCVGCIVAEGLGGVLKPLLKVAGVL